MEHLVEIFLPVRDDRGGRFPREAFDAVRAELTERFGGTTAFLRAPASGLWKEDDGGVDADEIVILEVMTGTLDRDWWAAYRSDLASRFRQEEVVVRATRIERL